MGLSMAKWEIHKRLGIWEALWWRFVPGKEVVVKWPVGKVVINDTMPEYDWTMGAARYEIDSADPNDHYRPWLEKNVGKQGWDWDWKLGAIAAESPGVVGFDTLVIKFRKSKEKYATIAAMRWI